MALSITMKKKLQEDFFVLYEVIDYLHNNPFYIGIDLQNKKIHYYKSNNSDYTKPDASITYLDPNKKMEALPNVCRSTSNWIIAQMYKATINNDFPMILNYASL
jgi:hypothetical protein